MKVFFTQKRKRTPLSLYHKNLLVPTSSSADSWIIGLSGSEIFNLFPEDRSDGGAEFEAGSLLDGCDGPL